MHSGPHRALLDTNGLNLGGGQDNNFSGSQRCDNGTCVSYGPAGSPQPAQSPQPQPSSPAATASPPAGTPHNNYGYECNGNSNCQNKATGNAMSSPQAAAGGASPNNTSPVTTSCVATGKSSCASSQGPGAVTVQSNGSPMPRGPGSPVAFAKDFPFGPEAADPPANAAQGNSTYSSSISCSGTASCSNSGPNSNVTQNNG